MVHEGLTEKLQALGLSEPKYLPFNPTGDKGWLREKFDEIPRYLFRVSTPKSDGTTDRFWVKSKDARRACADSRVDVLASDRNQHVASMLNRHLRWWGKSTDSDNFVSWTSSLLFALQYIFYRHTSSRDGSSLDSIYLCIVDTNSFPKGTFIRDIDLIRAYSLFDSGLKDFEGLRTRKHRDFAGSFYFGEYLSQGALKIEDKCQLVSAQAIIDLGLFKLQPGFSKSMVAKKPAWANEVIRLREVFYQNLENLQPATKEELEAAINIAQLFGPSWRLPIAANLISLLPRQTQDEVIFQAFTAAPFTGLAALLLLPSNKLTGKVEERDNCSPSKTKVMVYDTLPEVQQYDDIMRSVHKYNCLTKMKSQFSIIGLFFLKVSTDDKACAQTALEKPRLGCAMPS